MTRLAAARAILEIAREEPRSALEGAAALLAESGDAEIQATARFAMGLAHRTLANGGESTEHLEKAAQLAEDLPDLRGQVLRSLAFNYAQAGDHGRADSAIDRSIDLLDGQERDLSRLQKAFLLLMRGEHRNALPTLTAAVAGFTATGDEDYLELTLYNRALAFMEAGDYDASIADLTQAYEIAVRLDHQVSAADAALHLSQVLGWRDEVPEAMRWHDRSVELRTAAGAANPLADTEHAFVLIQARLLREAEMTLRRALPRLVAAGDNEAIAIAGRLLLADVLTEQGDHAGAAAQIAQARAESPQDGRWRFDIAAAAHRTRIAAGEVTTALLESMVATAADMEANSEPHPAAVERLRAVPVALALGDMAAAEKLATAGRRTAATGPLWLQIQGWTALGQLRFAQGNRRGTAAAVRAGIARVEEYRKGIGATDLRLRAAELGAELAQMGVDLALQSGSAVRTFGWSERLRQTGAGRAVNEDADLGPALVELRRATAQARTADPGSAPDAMARLQQAEARVTALTRRAKGEGKSSAGLALTDVQAQLEDRVLVEMIVARDSIWAVVADSSSQRLVSLGATAPIAETVDHLRFAAERIARPNSSTASVESAIESADQAAMALNARLIEPLGISAFRLVIVPSGFLHGIPWSLVTNVPVETAPSAALWARCRQRPAHGGQALIARGPGLSYATAEAERISAHGDAFVTDTVAGTIARFPMAAQAHFACHARPRVDNPMFSSLVLEDGELTLHDIERLGGTPTTIVLAACSGGATVLASGEEVISLAGSFLEIGARTVLAPLFTVSDAATAEVMATLHASLAAGTDPALALHQTRGSSTGVGSFTAGSFSCFGAA